MEQARAAGAREERRAIAAQDHTPHQSRHTRTIAQYVTDQAPGRRDQAYGTAGQRGPARRLEYSERDCGVRAAVAAGAGGDECRRCLSWTWSRAKGRMPYHSKLTFKIYFAPQACRMGNEVASFSAANATPIQACLTSMPALLASFCRSRRLHIRTAIRVVDVYMCMQLSPNAPTMHQDTCAL